jgi:hypothetical protein
LGGALQVLRVNKPARDHQSMKRAQPVSILSREWMNGRAALLAVAVLGVLAAPPTPLTRDAGVHGIPRASADCLDTPIVSRMQLMFYRPAAGVCAGQQAS